MRILGQDILPVAGAYLVFLSIFVWYASRGERGRLSRQERSAARIREISWPVVLRGVIVTMIGAYVVFGLIIVIFYLALAASPRRFAPLALMQGAVFGFGIVLPALGLLAWAEAAWRRRRPRHAR
jgi:hypothetical protein